MGHSRGSTMTAVKKAESLSKEQNMEIEAERGAHESRQNLTQIASPPEHGPLAAVIYEPRTTRLAQQEIPEPGISEVVVRIEGCGVCASSIPTWEGREWFSYPLEPGAPGHEAWGVVVRKGSDSNLEVGQRVAILSQ